MNKEEGPLPKCIKLEEDHSQEDHHTKFQSPEFYSKRLLLRGDQLRSYLASLFIDFHRQYWGNHLDPALTTLPTHAMNLDGLELGNEQDLSGNILPGNPFLDILDVPFLVRAEYIRAFDKVKATYNKYCRNHLALVTGQPGIGAAPSAVYSA